MNRKGLLLLSVMIASQSISSVVYAYTPGNSVQTTVIYQSDKFRKPSFFAPRIITNTGTPILIDQDLTIESLPPTLDKQVNSPIGSAVD
jgi:hypothetical protein